MINVVYPINWRIKRTGLPCNCMCSEQRTRKKLARINVAILLANHKGRGRIIQALKDKKRYFEKKLNSFLDESQNT